MTYKLQRFLSPLDNSTISVYYVFLTKIDFNQFNYGSSICGFVFLMKTLSLQIEQSKLDTVVCLFGDFVHRNLYEDSSKLLRIFV